MSVMAIYRQLTKCFLVSDKRIAGYFRSKNSGKNSLINRMNATMEITAIHHGLKITGNRKKKRMNANQRQPDGLLSSLFTSIPYAALCGVNE